MQDTSVVILAICSPITQSWYLVSFSITRIPIWTSILYNRTIDLVFRPLILCNELPGLPKVSYRINHSQLEKVYKIETDSRGLFYLTALKHGLIGLGAFQLVNLCIFLIKNCNAQSIVVAIVFVISVIASVYIVRTFKEDVGNANGDVSYTHPNLISQIPRVFVHGDLKTSVLEEVGQIGEVTSDLPDVIVEGGGNTPNVYNDDDFENVHVAESE